MRQQFPYSPFAGCRPATRWHLFVPIVALLGNLPALAQGTPLVTPRDHQGLAAQVSGPNGSAGSTVPPSAIKMPSAVSLLTSLTSHTIPSIGLTILTSTAVHASAANIGTYDFGLTDVLDTPRVEQTFTLRNDGNTPLALERMEPSCHCTTAVIQPMPGTAASSTGSLPTLAPGQQVSVHVAVNLAGDAPGRLTKSVAVYVKGNMSPAALLQVNGDLRSSLTFSPALLDFGPVSTTGTRSATLTATLDARLAPGGKLPPLVSSNHDVRITATPAVLSASARPGVPSTLLATYTLTLRSAPIGPVTGTVSFVPEQQPARPGSKSAVPFSTLSATLTSATVLLAGQVTGDLSPSPQTLAFGPIPLGRETTRQVLLTAQTPEAGEKLRVESASPWLSGRLLDEGAAAQSGQPSTRVLQVTLSPQAPPGVLQSQIKVVLANGQRLLLPVSAYVTPTPAQ